MLGAEGAAMTTPGWCGERSKLSKSAEQQAWGRSSSAGPGARSCRWRGPVACSSSWPRRSRRPRWRWWPSTAAIRSTTAKGPGGQCLAPRAKTVLTDRYHRRGGGRGAPWSGWHVRAGRSSKSGSAGCPGWGRSYCSER